MSPDNFMQKVRQWDNNCARWMMRHFYFIFFEFVLVFIFFLFFYNVIRTIDLSAKTTLDNIRDQLLLQQNIHTLLIIFLLLLNSFWMLFMFNGISRLRVILKDISFQIMRCKSK